MSTASEDNFVSFLNNLMRRNKIKPNRLAIEVGVSHTTMSRWLSGKTTPDLNSCKNIALYAGVSTDKVLSVVGLLPETAPLPYANWPEFREYATRKYAHELDEDLITIIEAIIERNRQNKWHRQK
jgi:transcriptional regulator with XRE-family HTH domain